MILRNMSLYVLTWRQLVLLVLKVRVVVALTSEAPDSLKKFQVSNQPLETN